jgi:hypothetical protein
MGFSYVSIDSEFGSISQSKTYRLTNESYSILSTSVKQKAYIEKE